MLIELLAPGFVSGGTLPVILSNASTLFVMGAGVTFAILPGGADLSVQAVASLARVVLAKLLPLIGMAAFPVAALVGMALGGISEANRRRRRSSPRSRPAALPLGSRCWQRTGARSPLRNKAASSRVG